jgi:peptide/nickel transport system ATP-binding protein
MSTAALSLRDVRVELSNGLPIIDGVSLEIHPGEVLGLVGESGSGKTTTALSIFGLDQEGLKVAAGDIVVAGHALGRGSSAEAARGRLASYVPQNPGTALNPSRRIAKAIEDLIHGAHSGSRTRPQELLESVGLPGDAAFGRRFPHQLSGGQQQRVCIAGSIASDPSLVVLDEPTTGLDVVTQARILKELVRLCEEEQLAMLYITHDLAVAAAIADRIAVMYGGEIVEQGPTTEVLGNPRHPYTRGLMASTPDHHEPRPLRAMPGIAVGVGERTVGCSFAARCPIAVPACTTDRPAMQRVDDQHEVRCTEWTRPQPDEHAGPSADRIPSLQPDGAPTAPVLSVENLRAEHAGRHGTVVAASDISFEVERGACVALVGESGSGKTTIARVIAGLHPIGGGRVLLDGVPLPNRAAKRSIAQRRRIQIVFQNPAEALNPRVTVGSAIARPARMLRGLKAREADAEVARLLDAVRLPARLADRYPRELSGGERQRVAIARALAAGPDLVVCDEVTSALDVSVQAVVLQLLRELRDELGLALVFITHDLGVVNTVADRVLVLNRGEICESGSTNDVLSGPQHAYTQSLLGAAPSLSTAIAARRPSRAGSAIREHKGVHA